MNEPEQPVKKYINDVIQCLSEPKAFFLGRFAEFTLTQALVFAIVTNWVASFLEWTTRLVRHETLLDGFLKIREQLESIPMWKTITPHIFGDAESSLNIIPSWMVELSSVILSPFNTLFSLVFTSLFLWLSATFLISKKEGQDPIEYGSFMKILAFATSAPKIIAAILVFLPLKMGTVVGVIYALCLEVIAISNRYQVSNARALGVVFLPRFIFMLLAGLVLGAIALALFGFFGSLFQH